MFRRALFHASFLKKGTLGTISIIDTACHTRLSRSASSSFVSFDVSWIKKSTDKEEKRFRKKIASKFFSEGRNDSHHVNSTLNARLKWFDEHGIRSLDAMRILLNIPELMSTPLDSLTDKTTWLKLHGLPHHYISTIIRSSPYLLLKGYRQHGFEEVKQWYLQHGVSNEQFCRIVSSRPSILSYCDLHGKYAFCSSLGLSENEIVQLTFEVSLLFSLPLSKIQERVDFLKEKGFLHSCEILRLLQHIPRFFTTSMEQLNSNWATLQLTVGNSSSTTKIQDVVLKCPKLLMIHGGDYGEHMDLLERCGYTPEQILKNPSVLLTSFTARMLPRYNHIHKIFGESKSAFNTFVWLKVTDQDFDAMYPGYLDYKSNQQDSNESYSIIADENKIADNTKFN